MNTALEFGKHVPVTGSCDEDGRGPRGGAASHPGKSQASHQRVESARRWRAEPFHPDRMAAGFWGWVMCEGGGGGGARLRRRIGVHGGERGIQENCCTRRSGVDDYLSSFADAQDGPVTSAGMTPVWVRTLPKMAIWPLRARMDRTRPLSSR